MTIEANLTAILEAQVRQAEALEGIYACLQVLVKRTEPIITGEPVEAPAKPASRGSRRQVKNVEREEPPVEETPPAEEPAAEEPEADPLDESDPLEEKEATADDVKEALRAYREINGTTAMMNLFKKYGASGMGSLKPADYAAIIKDAK